MVKVAFTNENTRERIFSCWSQNNAELAFQIQTLIEITLGKSLNLLGIRLIICNMKGLGLMFAKGHFHPLNADWLTPWLMTPSWS